MSVMANDDGEDETLGKWDRWSVWHRFSEERLVKKLHSIFYSGAPIKFLRKTSTDKEQTDKINHWKSRTTDKRSETLRQNRSSMIRSGTIEFR
jgi:hypothetical protein